MSTSEITLATYLAETRSHGSNENIPPPYELLPLDLESGAPKRTKTRLTAVLIGLYLALFIAAMDQVCVATIIPTIAQSLHSSSGFSWIGGSYLLAAAGAAPIWAKLSDIWGRKPILLVVVCWFGVSSIICATAKDMVSLIVGRSLQGIAGGGLIQLVTITLSDIFSMRSRTFFFALVEATWCLAGGIGPVMAGGFAIKSWRWAFYFNIPICAITFVLLFIFLDVHNPRTKTLDGLKAIDWTGSVIVIAMTVLVLLGLQFGGTTFPWSSPKVVVLIVVGALLSLVFIYAEKKLAKYPIMPLTLFQDSSNVATLITTLCHGIFFIGGEYFIPFYLQSSKGASSLKSGVLILPLVLMEAAGGIISGIIMHQTGRFRETIWIGMALSTLGLGMYITLTPDSSTASIIGFQLIGGFGSGCAFTTVMVAIQARVSQSDVATATSTLGFVRNIACSIGIVIGGAAISNGMEHQRSALAHAGLNQTALDMFASQDSAANVLLISRISSPHDQYLVQEAYSNAIRNAWIMFTAVAGAGLVASLFIKKAILSRDHTETKTGI